MSRIALLRQQVSTLTIRDVSFDVVNQVREDMKRQMVTYLEVNHLVPAGDFQWETKAQGYVADAMKSVDWEPGQELPEFAMWVHMLVQVPIED